MHLLQAHGVPAAPVLEASRILDDPHVQARGLNQPMSLYDGIGPFRFNAPFFRFESTPTGLRKAPVALGEDNDYIYGEVLGYSQAEIEELRARGHIGMDYDPEIV